jgi:hypothetical protein
MQDEEDRGSVTESFSEMLILDCERIRHGTANLNSNQFFADRPPGHFPAHAAR